MGGYFTPLYLTLTDALPGFHESTYSSEKKKNKDQNDHIDSSESGLYTFSKTVLKHGSVKEVK